MPLPQITIEKIIHKKRIRIFVMFRYNLLLINHLKKLDGHRWSASRKSWHFPDTPGMAERIKRHFNGLAQIEDKITGMPAINLKGLPKNRNISESTRKHLQGFIKFLYGKRYSESTVHTYSTFIADFMDYLRNKDINSINNRDVALFCEDILVPFNYSVNSQRQFISAVKQLKAYMPYLKIEDLTLERPHQSVMLPTVLSKEEVLRLLINTRNLKHRAALTMIYSSGLRISELLNLKLSDINPERRQVFVRNGKGRKDRVVIFAESFLPMFENYLATFRPQRYFIEGKPGV